MGHELDEVIDRLFPKQIGRGASKCRQDPLASDIPANFARDSCPIQAASSSYVQAVDTNQLMEIATEGNLLIWLQHRPGDFVVKGSPLALVYPAESVRKNLAEKIKDVFVLGSQRTALQDVEFLIAQLVEIAARALSPGINDPFTAIRCIDQLSAALCHLAEKEIPSAYRYDDEDKLRVIAESVTFVDATDVAFNQIRQYGQTSVGVTMRLLKAIAAIAPFTHTKSNRAALLRHANMIERGSHEGISEELDRNGVKERYLAAVKAIEQR